MNAYFTIVLLGFVLFFFVWGLGWLLESLSHAMLRTTQDPGSRSWYMLVGPGVALHESSHALGCVFTRTKIVEFKPINVERKGDQILLGYVKYIKPQSRFKNAIINLAPVAVSLVLLILFAFGATFLVPDRPELGTNALDLLGGLINLKSEPAQLAEWMYPLNAIGGFVYTFLYTFAQLTVINPVFWIIAFLAMTIMFSNAPSSVDIENASAGLKVIIVFNFIWLIIAYFLPQAGWLLFGVYEALAVLFSLALAFAAVGYGFFILVAAMARLRSPFQLIPFLGCILTGVVFYLLGPSFQAVVSLAMQTIISVGVFVVIALPMLMMKSLRK
ncbi:MAG: hypothetical protein ACFFE2_15490 [Candidatus Thorarchaeota archaeon]